MGLTAGYRQGWSRHKVLDDLVLGLVPGTVTGLVLHQNGQDMPGRKIR